MRSANSTIRYTLATTLIFCMISCASVNYLKNYEENTVRALIESGVDANRQDKDGITLLMMASVEGKPKTVQYLIEKGADVNLANNNGGTALLYAAGKGNIKCAELLIKNGASIEARTKQLALTPLMHAARHGGSKFVDFLLGKGADISAVNSADYSALTYAIFSENHRTIRLLIAAGADTTILDASGNSLSGLLAQKLNIKDPKGLALNTPNPMGVLFGAIGGGLAGGVKAVMTADKTSRYLAIIRILEFGERYRDKKVTNANKVEFSKKLSLLCDNIKNDSFYSQKNGIPKQILSDAKTNFAISTGIDIIAIIEASVFSGAKKGIALCKDGLYWNTGEGANFIDWNQFAETDLIPSERSDFDLFLGNKTISTTGSDFNAPELILLLSEIQNYFFYGIES